MAVSIVCAAALMLFPLISAATEPPLASLPGATAADLVTSEQGLGIIRPGALGLGAYLYHPAIPGAGVSVRVDGIPLRSRSPLGPDFDTIPAIAIDSLSTDTWREVRISTLNHRTAGVETDINFLLGARHRFATTLTYRTPLSKTSRLSATGLSSGMHGAYYSDGTFTPKTSFRDYRLNYQRDLKQGGTLTFSLSGNRDRDGLANLTNRTPLGERRTDVVTSSVHLSALPLGKRTLLTAAVYHEESTSRFDRTLGRSSLDDDLTGVFIESTRRLGASVYTLTGSWDLTRFDSRIHDTNWTRGQGNIDASFDRALGPHRLHLSAGSRHGAGIDDGIAAAADYGFTLAPSVTITLSGKHETILPDPSLAWYPALTVSNTRAVPNLGSWTVSGAETGVRIGSPLRSFSGSLFVSRAETPAWFGAGALLAPAGAGLFTGDLIGPAATGAGYRISLAATDTLRSRYPLHGSMALTHRLSPANRWPFPRLECTGATDASGVFFSGNLTAQVFGDISASWWGDRDLAPEGLRVLANAGLSIRVGTVECFYRLENILGYNDPWFGAMSWEGRNGWWGVTWHFVD